MAAALEPVIGGVKVRRENLDAITGGRDFDPQLTGRGKKGTKLERKDLRQGEKLMPREEDFVFLVDDHASSPASGSNVEWEPFPPPSMT